MKRRKIIIFVSIMLALFTVCGCANDRVGDGEEVFEFNLAHFFPVTHPAEKVLVDSWIDAILEATDGRVKITSYPQETLCKADEIYEGVVSGYADIGLSCFAYTRGRFPLLEAFELPGVVYESSWAASKIAWDGIRELDLEEVQDTKLMMVLATGSGDLFTTKPVNNLEDLQGMKIRATGLSAETLKTLGAVPEAMPQSDAYEALSRGLVQGNLAPVEVLQGWGHADVTDYLTFTPFLYNTLFFITMNLEKWNALPEDLQEAILKVNERIHEDLACSLWDEQNREALDWARDEKGMEMITLADAEAARWIEAVVPIQEDFVERMSKQGLDGRTVLDKVIQLAGQYGK